MVLHATTDEFSSMIRLDIKLRLIGKRQHIGIGLLELRESLEIERKLIDVFWIKEQRFLMTVFDDGRILLLLDWRHRQAR